jgi:peroxiredoxin
MSASIPAKSFKEVFHHCRDLDASLNERLDCFARAVQAINPAFAGAVERLIARLQRSGAGAQAPRVGDSMPPFVLPDERGRLVSLEALLEKGPVAVTFHRGHWCPYCRISVAALAQAQRELEPGAGQIVAIMPDRQQFAEEFRSEANAQFPILTDMDNGYALSLNLAIWVGEEMQSLIAGAGRDVPSYQANDSWVLPMPATFVVGRDGRIRRRFVDPDYRKRMTIEDMLGALRAG